MTAPYPPTAAAQGSTSASGPVHGAAAGQQPAAGLIPEEWGSVLHTECAGAGRTAMPAVPPRTYPSAGALLPSQDLFFQGKGWL